MSSAQRTATLADELRLPCGTTLPNRLAKAAMSEQLGSRDGAPTAELERLYARWARGGVGLQISGNVMIDRRSLGEPRNVVVEDGRHAAELARLAAAASEGGTVALVQVNHPGRQAPVGVASRIVAPSAIPIAYRGPFAKPKALTD
jgi:2,4-dienoyl-CoA reductase-like NADH-dependent reductase (Old Yellow Enzyme family)